MTKKEFYEKMTDKVKAAMKEVNEAQKEIKKLETEVNSGMYSDKTVSEKRSRISSLKWKMKTLPEDIRVSVQRMSTDFISELDANDTIKYKELTDDAKLLTMGLPLNEKDLKQILERNENNRTMIKLVLRYADAHGIHLPVQYNPKASEVGDPDAFAYAAEVCVKHGSQTVYDQIMGEGSELAARLND